MAGTTVPNTLAQEPRKRPVRLLAMKVLPGDQRTGCELEPGGHKGDKEISHESGLWVPLIFS